MLTEKTAYIKSVQADPYLSNDQTPDTSSYSSPYLYTEAPDTLLLTFASLINVDEFKIQVFNDGSGSASSFHVSRTSQNVPNLKKLNPSFNIAFRRNQAQKLKDADSWRSVLIEYDNIEKELQISLVRDICIENNIPFPTCCVDTGNKSYHFYWTFEEPTALEDGENIQLRFLQLFQSSDDKFKSVVQASRLPGFKHIKTGKLSELYIWSDTKYSFEQLDVALPALIEVKKVFTNTSISKKGFQSKPIVRTQKNVSKLDKLKKEYEYIVENYELTQFSCEKLKTKLDDAVNKIENSIDGTINDVIFNESLKIGSILPKGLDFNSTFSQLEQAINRRISQSPGKSIKHGLTTCIDGLTNGFFNVINETVLVKKSNGYNFTPDIVINQQFLDESVLEVLKNNRVIALKSAIGTGKTTLIKNYIKNLVTLIPNVRILVVVHRKKLTVDYINKLTDLGFVVYNDPSYRNVPLNDHNKLIITTDSLPNLPNLNNETSAFENYDFVIFDECDQQFEHLTFGNTEIKNRRLQTIDTVRYLLNNSKSIIITSATLSNIEVDFVSEISNIDSKSIKKVENIHKPLQKQYVRYKDKETILKKVHKAIAENRPIAIAVNSIEYADALYEIIKTKYENKNIRCITSKNADDQLDFINSLLDPNSELDVDILIYTPILGTGFDISRKYFDIVFGIFEKNEALSATDLLQMCGRIRCPFSNEIHVYVESGILNTERSAEKILEHYRKIRDIPHKLDASTGRVVPYDVQINNAFLNYVAQSKSRKNRSLYNLNFNFWQQVKSNGHQITFNDEKDESKTNVNEVKAIKKEIKQREIDDIYNAKVINEIEVENLNRKSKHTQLDKHELASLGKYYFSRNTGFNKVDKETLDWYEYNNGKKVCNNIELLLMPITIATIKDYMEQDVNGTKTQVDFKCFSKRKTLLEKLLQLIKDSMGTVYGRNKSHVDVFSEDTLESSSFTEFIRLNFKEIKIYLGFTPDLDKPVRTAKTILGLVGLELEGKQIRNIDNQRIRIYKVTEVSQLRYRSIAQNIFRPRLREWKEYLSNLKINYQLRKHRDLPQITWLFTEIQDYLDNPDNAGTPSMLSF